MATILAAVYWKVSELPQAGDPIPQADMDLAAVRREAGDAGRGWRYRVSRYRSNRVPPTVEPAVEPPFVHGVAVRLPAELSG